MKLASKAPQIFLILYGILFILCAINPTNRAVWWAENLPVMLAVITLVVSYKKFQFSNFSYFLMWFFLCFHTIGGHYTFEKVPFNGMNALLNSLPFDFLFPHGRNNFDRVGHFLVGVFAYPISEFVWRKKYITTIGYAIAFGIFALGFWGAFYEIIEMIYALTEGGEEGAAFLGSQGDIWDAQKDMFLDILGAMGISILFYFHWKPQKTDAN